MILPKFDFARAMWDDYKAFHNNHHPIFVQFDTGELICTHTKVDPNLRHLWTNLGVSLYFTTDEKCPPLYEESQGGNPIPKAWLNDGGGQYLLVDYMTRQVVRLSRGLTNIPVRLRGRATAYFAGAGEPPIGGKIELSKPESFTKNELEHIETISQACRAWAALNDLKLVRGPGRFLHARGCWEHNIEGTDTWVINKQGPRHLVVDVSFDTLTDAHKAQIAFHGLSTGREKFMVDRLYIRDT